MAVGKRHEQLNDSESLSQSARRRLKRSLKRRQDRAKKSSSWSIRNIIGATVALVGLLYLPYLLISSEIINYLVKRNGTCVTGVITTQRIHGKYHKPYYQYKISVNGAEYTGNSLYTDESKVGDSICVLYLRSFPSNSRPINFFDADEKVNCNCK